MRLPDPDRGEERPERDESDHERARKPGRERRARDHCEAGREREDEERERDRPGTLVPGPQVRRRGERDERGEREREQERRRGGSITAKHPVRQRKRRRGQHEVQGKEQECLLLAQLDRDAKRRDGEECDGNDGGIAHEGNCSEDDGDDPDPDERDALTLREQELEVVVPDQEAHEAGGADAQKRQSDDGQEAVAREQHQHRAERADEGGNLGGIHGANLTLAIE